MSKKPTKKSIAFAVSATLAVSLTGSALAQAEAVNESGNLLGAVTLDSGYMQFAKANGDNEGKCGEGKCGDAKGDEGKCGGDKDGEDEEDKDDGEK